jgi:hypothetical protein
VAACEEEVSMDWILMIILRFLKQAYSSIAFKIPLASLEDKLFNISSTNFIAFVNRNICSLAL